MSKQIDHLMDIVFYLTFIPALFLEIKIINSNEVFSIFGLYRDSISNLFIVLIFFILLGILIAIYSNINKSKISDILDGFYPGVIIFINSILLFFIPNSIGNTRLDLNSSLLFFVFFYVPLGILGIKNAWHLMVKYDIQKK